MTTSETMQTIRLPLRFFDDHHDRGLDTPSVIRRTKRHVWVSADDPHLAELVSDADLYADPTGFDPSCRGICFSALATLRAILSVRPDLKPAPFTLPPSFLF